jgi:hypothetical protein
MVCSAEVQDLQSVIDTWRNSAATCPSISTAAATGTPICKAKACSTSVGSQTQERSLRTQSCQAHVLPVPPHLQRCTWCFWNLVAQLLQVTQLLRAHPKRTGACKWHSAACSTAMQHAAPHLLVSQVPASPHTGVHQPLACGTCTHAKHSVSAFHPAAAEKVAPASLPEPRQLCPA